MTAHGLVISRFRLYEYGVEVEYGDSDMMSCITTKT